MPKDTLRVARIKDVAERASVSTAAVSYVLNNTGSVSKETAERVLQAVKELNYRPNSIAKSLKTNKTRSIGVIVEDITVFNAPEIINGINEWADNEGYSIILSNLRLINRIGNNLRDISKYQGLVNRSLQEMYFKRVDGLIYVAVHSRDVKDLVEDVKKPIVLAYCYSTEPAGCYVTYDNRTTAYHATKYLLNAHHTEIGFITGPSELETTIYRLRGCADALEEAHLSLSKESVVEGDWEYESGYNGARDLLARKEPSAICAMNDLMALGAMAYCQENGVGVPEKISVLGFDNRESSRYFVPQLTTMAMPLNEIGRISTKMIMSLLNNEEMLNKHVRLPCALVERNSVRHL